MPVKRDGSWSPRLPVEVKSSYAQILKSVVSRVDLFSTIMAAMICFVFGHIFYIQIQSDIQEENRRCSALAHELVKRKALP